VQSERKNGLGSLGLVGGIPGMSFAGEGRGSLLSIRKEWGKKGTKSCYKGNWISKKEEGSPRGGEGSLNVYVIEARLVTWDGKKK